MRRVLGDDRRVPRLIRTVQKVGYRFIASVEEVAAPEINGQTAAARPATRHTQANGAASTRGRFSRVSWALTLVAGVAILLALLFSWSAEQPSVEAGPTAAGRTPLVVLYFENRSGDPELDWLREGLTDMLTTDLTRSRQLSVPSRHQLDLLLERIGYERTKPIRLDQAIEVGRRGRAEAVALGSFARLGNAVRIDVQLYETSGGRLLAAETLTADTLDDVLGRVDLLSLRLASHLGRRIDTAEGQPGIAATMTRSVEAYRHYSLALEAARSYHSTEALALLEKAVGLDPEFAMAYARIGYTYAMVRVGEADKARHYLERAFQLSDRLTPKDKLYVMAWYANPNLVEVERLYREIVRQYPEEIEAWWRLGELLQYSGRSAEAIEILERGLEADPESQELYNQLGNCYAGLGRYAEAIAAHERYVELAPQEANARDSLAMTYNEAGRYDRAIEELERALAFKPDFHFAHLHLGDAYAGQGRYRQAVAQYERYLKLAPTAWDRGVGWQRLSRLHWRSGNLERASAAALEESRHHDFGDALLLALARGDVGAATKMAGDLPGHTAVVAHQPDHLRGYLALKTGRPAEAIERFKRALATPPVFFWYENMGPDALADAYFELDRWDEAIAEYTRLVGLNPAWARAHYRLGVAYERRGQRDQALRAYRRFLEVWKQADLDLPDLADAKARLTRLEARASR